MESLKRSRTKTLLEELNELYINLNEIKEKINNLQNQMNTISYELENERLSKKTKPSYIN